MMKKNKDITLQVGDQCRVLEDNPYSADVGKGDIVTITSVTEDGITVLDDRNIEWRLDDEKIEPLGTNELDENKEINTVEGITTEVDVGEVVNDVISDLDDHLSDCVDEYVGNDSEAVEATLPKEERVYLAGPISTEGDVMYMSYLAEEIRNLGYHVHAPHEDESINDKTNDPSADDIFANDTDAIDISDIVVLVESGREQVGTHMEAGKIIERIEQGAPLELVVFTSNYRVEDTQVEDGKASASVNHYALGGYKRAGTWVDGMSAGMLEYMKERKYPQEVGYEYDCEKEFQNLTDEEFGIFEGDIFVTKDGITRMKVKELLEHTLVFEILNTVREETLQRSYATILNKGYLKQLEDGRLINYSAEIVYKDNEHAKEDGIHVE